MTKHFRFLYIFQIYPANLENIPVSDMQRHFPAIIEYWTTEEKNVPVPSMFEEVKNLFTTTGRMMNKLDLLLCLLTSFSNNLFFRYTNSTGTSALPMLKDNPREEVNEWSSNWSL